MHGPSQYKVCLYIPLQVIYNSSATPVFLFKQRVVTHVIQDGKPVSRRRFGVRSIGPKLSQHPCIITPLHNLWCIWLTSYRVDRITIFLVATVHVIVKVVIARNIVGHFRTIAQCLG